MVGTYDGMVVYRVRPEEKAILNAVRRFLDGEPSKEKALRQFLSDKPTMDQRLSPSISVARLVALEKQVKELNERLEALDGDLCYHRECLDMRGLLI